MLCNLNNDILLLIYKKYLCNMNLYYCNLALISKSWYTISKLLYKSSKFNKFNIPIDEINRIYNTKCTIGIESQCKRMIDTILTKLKLKSIYYVRSNKYNVRLCKLYFWKNRFYNFGLIHGNEGELLCNLKNTNYSKSQMIQFLNYYEYIVL